MVLDIVQGPRRGEPQNGQNSIWCKTGHLLICRASLPVKMRISTSIVAPLRGYHHQVQDVHTVFLSQPYFLIGSLVLDVTRVFSTAILIKKQVCSRSSPFDLLIPRESNRGHRRRQQKQCSPLHRAGQKAMMPGRLEQIALSYVWQDDVKASVYNAWHISPLCRMLVERAFVLDGTERFHDKHLA